MSTGKTPPEKCPRVAAESDYNSSYMWAGSTTISTRWNVPSTWESSIYWTRWIRHEPGYALMADTVSWELAQSWEGGWPWMRQNNHFDPDKADRLLAAGGNVVNADGSGRWLDNNGTNWNHNGQYAEHWPDACIQAQASSADPATQYWFSNPDHNYPSGPKRGRFIP